MLACLMVSVARPLPPSSSAVTWAVSYRDRTQLSEWGMFRAEICPSSGIGCARPPRESGGDQARSSKTIARSVVHADLPSPIDFLAFVVFSSLKTDLLEALFKRPVGVCVFENDEVNHNIKVERASVLWNNWGPFRN